MEQLNVTKTKQGNGGIKPILCQGKRPNGPQSSVTAELVQPNKKTISLDKSHICDNNSQMQKLSKTSDQVLTTKEKAFKPYWNASCEAISSQLLWLTETDYVDSDLNCLTIWSDKTVEKSWFSKNLIQAQNQNLFQTFCQYYMSSRVESMDSEDTITASKKIRILPNQKQKQILKQWLGTYRFVYNQTLNLIQKKNKTPFWLSIKTEIIKNLPIWAAEIPYQIKSLAIKEAIQNLRQQKKLVWSKKRKRFKMHFKSKKDLKQSCYIPKTAVNQKGIYPRILKKLRYTENLPETIMDSRLVMAYNKFYIVIPTKRKRSLIENQDRVVAIDPGIRKFITFVSHDRAGHLAQYDIGRIYRLCYYLDDLISRISKVKSKQKRNLKKAASRIREKIKNLIYELHWKTAKFLVNNFDVILLPTFETSQMVSKKAKRKIRSKTARAMMTFSHYKFKQRLKQKAFEYGKIVVDTNEAYTSQTNNFTGEINKKLGSKKYINFKDKRIDRDINGALGILLKALGDTPFLNNHSNCTVNKS